MAETTPEIPDSARPKVAETAIAGALATAFVWAWNINFPEMSPWHAGDLIIGAWVTLITWLTGPLIRRYQVWAEGGSQQSANMIALAKDVRALALEVKALKEKP